MQLVSRRLEGSAANLPCHDLMKLFFKFLHRATKPAQSLLALRLTSVEISCMLLFPIKLHCNGCDEETSCMMSMGLQARHWFCICSLHVRLPMRQRHCSCHCPSILMQQLHVSFALPCVAHKVVHRTAHAAAVRPLLAVCAAAIWRDHSPLVSKIRCQSRCRHRYSLSRSHELT